MTHRARTAGAALCLLVAVSGCDSEVVPPEEDRGVSLVSVYLTDAPGDVAQAWVDVVEIYLQGSEGRTVLLDEPTGLIELTSLAETAVPLVTEEEVEPGAYGQLRFVIGGAVLETTAGMVYSKDGTEHPEGLEVTGQLHCPSCSQTGIKVLLRDVDLELQEGNEDLVLDFDVSQSFGRQAGQSGMWVMRPVIHGVKMAEMGRIAGTVALATDEEGEPALSIPECPEGTARSLADFVPTATAMTLTDDEGEPVVRTGSTDEDGGFHIGTLTPDEYQLSYLSEASFEGARLVWTAEVNPSAVTVGANGSVTGVEYTITAATCETDGGEEG